MCSGPLRKAGSEPGNLVRAAPDRLDGLGSLHSARIALPSSEPISNVTRFSPFCWVMVTAPMKFTCAMLSASRKKIPVFGPSLLPMQNTVPPVSETPTQAFVIFEAEMGGQDGYPPQGG